MAEHELQHTNGPTWCVHCGRFDIYCTDECTAPRTRTYDTSNAANYKRMVDDLFGLSLGAEANQSVTAKS